MKFSAQRTVLTNRRLNMRLLICLCFLKLCLANLIKNNTNWLTYAKDCIHQEILDNRVLIITDNVTKNDSKIIDSVTEEILQVTPGIVFDVTDFKPWKKNGQMLAEKSAFKEISHSNAFIVYFSRSKDSYKKLKSFYSFISDGEKALPKTISFALDTDRFTTYDSLNSSQSDETEDEEAKSKFKCFDDRSAEILTKGIQANLNPTSYIDLKQEKLKGPEGKIAQTLIESINVTFSITKSNSSWKGITIKSDKVGMLLNLKQPPVMDLNSIKKAIYTWTLVYHPYRTFPLVPVLKRDWNTENYLEYCLLAMVTIMIILLLHIIRKLITINDLDDCENAFHLVYNIMIPKSVLSAVEKFFFFCLVMMFFVNVGILLEMIFCKKYGADRKEVIENVRDLRRLNLSPVAPLKECLRQMIVKRSKNVFCIVEEDYGRRVVKRYGKDGKENLIKLVSSINVDFEWRGMFLTSAVHLERFNRLQLRFLESGLLDKWYENEMMINNSVLDEKIMPRSGWSKIDAQQERSSKFVYHLILVIFNGCLMAFLMFVGEFIMFGVKMSETRVRYIYFE